MSATIDFAIDLGTTNSVIAKFNEGEVEVFKNPMGHKEVLPSVVGFRKERIIVGDKARELLEKDAKNVVGLFKRKMGTSESFQIPATGTEVTPVDLSAHVLRELKNFIHTGEAPDEVVITIPASFDTVQSNATLEAGKQAGFSSVSLLQEPIAASLAFVNKQVKDKDKEGQWLVFDLGGGTFDVALIRLTEGEMTVVDHAGDNFLGGTDFDQLIIDKFVIPKMQAQGTFKDLGKEMKSASGKYNRLYNELLFKAEEVKIMLSSREQAEIEFDVEDDTGEDLEFYLELGRQEFNDIIRPTVMRTIQFMKSLMGENQLSASNVESILMIGGSTFIPLVREQVESTFGISVDYSVDPTTAVAVGAGYYAGSKPKKVETKKEEPTEAPTERTTTSGKITLKTAFQRHTQESEEYFTALVSGEYEGHFYRISRLDGGFDTGLRHLKDRIEEDLPLIPNAQNSFSFKVFNPDHQLVVMEFSAFTISQGKFGVLGQPLPADISLEVDDPEDHTTHLEVIFEKNSLLPLRKTLTKEVAANINVGSEDALVINILEGKQDASPASNKPIGIIRIAGKDLERDLLRGTDVEITVEMTESRDLKVATYLMMTGQEFENVFSPSQRYVDVNKLKGEIFELLEKIREEVSYAEGQSDYERAAEIKKLEDEAYEVYMRILDLTEDDVTDAKFQMEDQKRQLFYRLDELTKNKRLTSVLQEYDQVKASTKYQLEENGTPEDWTRWESLLEQEKAAIASGNHGKIKRLTDQMHRLRAEMGWRAPEYIKNLFFLYSIEPDEMYTDLKRKKDLVKKGNDASDKDRIDELRAIINSLSSIYKGHEKEGGEFLNRTGLT